MGCDGRSGSLPLTCLVAQTALSMVRAEAMGKTLQAKNLHSSQVEMKGGRNVLLNTVPGL